MDVISLFSGALGAVLGSMVPFVLWYWQDRVSRKREWIANHLRGTYYNLLDATTYPDFGDGQSFDRKLAFSKVLNDIGLFGDAATIEIAADIASRLKLSEETKEWVSYEPLFKALRDQLRRELGLKKVEKFIVMHVKKVEDDSTVKPS